MENQLLIAVQLTSISEILDWENVFRIIGVNRCKAMFVDAGLPLDLANNSGGLVNAAYYFWQVRWSGITWEGKTVGQGYSDPNFPENYRLGAQTLLRDTFNIILQTYNEASVRELYSWIHRHFLDKRQINCWYIWSFLLSTIVRGHNSNDQVDLFVPLPFSDDVSAGIVAAVNKNFGAEVKRIWDKKIEQAQNVPLSSFEERILKLEATRPTDIEEFDALGMVRTIAENQHVYQFWKEIDSWITESEKESFLWWGYDQAAAIGIPVQDVILPELSKDID